MKIYYSTDMHEDLDSLLSFYSFARDNNADLIIVSGDLADCSVPSDEAPARMELFQAMQKVAFGELRRRRVSGITNYMAFNAIPLIASDIVSGNNYPKEWRCLASCYLDNLDKHVRVMDSFYSRLDIIASDDVMFLPGNHDRDLRLLGYASRPELFRKLKGSDMHLKKKEFNGLTFAGYGGACTDDGFPAMHQLMLGEVTVAFNEQVIGIERDGRVEKSLHSEAADYLLDAKPDIALVHSPPYGFLDDEKLKGSDGQVKEYFRGSHGIRHYAESGLANIILCGHMHSNKGIVKIPPMEYSALDGAKEIDGNSAILINPGPLGRHVYSSGLLNFAEILVDDTTKSFDSATFYSSVDRNDTDSIAPVLRAYISNDKINMLHLSQNLPDDVMLKDRRTFRDADEDREKLMRKIKREGLVNPFSR